MVKYKYDGNDAAKGSGKDLKNKTWLLSVLLVITLSTVAFLTVKYIRTVRAFNAFYQLAQETAQKIDSETERLESEIILLEDRLYTLNTELQTVTAERNELASQLYNQP